MYDFLIIVINFFGEIEMSKKTIMFCIFTINLLIFLIYSVMEFIYYPIQQIEKDKAIVTVKCHQNIEPEEYINIIYNASEKLHEDVMISIINDDYTNDYYRTSADPAFIKLDCIDDLTAAYSTNPKNNERKIRGFFIGSNNFRILPLNTILERDIDTSIQQFIISEDAVDSFASIFVDKDIEILSGMGKRTNSDFSYLNTLLIVFAIFLLIAEIFYVFSCSKEMIISKAMGYSNFNIVCSQLKKCGYLFIVISFDVLLTTIIVSSIAFDFSSALLFGKKILAKYLIYMIGAILFFMIAVIIVSSRCSIANNKGKSLNRDLFVITATFKTVIIIFLAVSMTSLSKSTMDMINILKSTKQATKLVAGYAATELNTRLENPIEEPEKYAPILLDFYNKLNINHDIIIADFDKAEKFEDEQNDSENEHSHNHLKINYPTVTINDTYLNKNETIFDLNGNKINSSVLQKEKFNILVPENCEIDILKDKYTRTEEVSVEELNFIYYSHNSKFFTYSNEICASNSGFCTNVIAQVYDPVFEYNHYSNMTFSAFMSSLLSNSQYFSYDNLSDESPYEQILPILKETGADKIMVSAPDVGELFNSNVKYYKNICLFEIAQFLIILISFIILLVFTTELYYRNYAKDISLKLINGYSFADMYMYRMIFKAAILPFLLLIGTVSIWVALFCVIAEQLIFIICIKKNMRKNTITILKGE